jgi:hypothetical protein
MAKVKNRIASLEKKALFWQWFHFSRFLEGLSHEQIEEIALNWRFPEPLPEPLPWGMSELDRLDRKSLMRQFEESERETSRIMRETAEHSEDERRFYVRHGHWPERACGHNVLCRPQKLGASSKSGVGPDPL